MEPRVPVYILAGGRSRRFGSDKARALFDGEPLICRVRRLVASVALSITVVSDQPGKYADLQLPTIADDLPGLGPLTGLATALTHAGDAPWLMLCACDAVVIQEHWLTTLLDNRSDEADAVAFRGEKWQPVPALFAASSAPLVRGQLQSENRSMQRLLDRLRTVSLAMPSDWPDCWQVNRSEDLELLKKRVPPGPPVP